MNDLLQNVFNPNTIDAHELQVDIYNERMIEFQIHVFEDPSARQMINTGWPLLLSFVGIMFAWGMAQI